MPGEFFVKVPVTLGRLGDRGLQRWHAQQLAAFRQLCCTIAITKKAEISDALKTRWKNMQQETPDELVRRERHRLLLVMVLIILPAKADPAFLHIEQTVIGNGDSVCVAADVVQHLLGPGERTLGVDYPLGLARGSQMA